MSVYILPFVLFVKNKQNKLILALPFKAQKLDLSFFMTTYTCFVKIDFNGKNFY